MSGEAWLVIGLLVTVLALSELARRLERTDLRVYLRNVEKLTETQPNHFHSIGFGVLAPCDDERCPEWRTP